MLLFQWICSFSQEYYPFPGIFHFPRNICFPRSISLFPGIFSFSLEYFLFPGTFSFSREYFLSPGIFPSFLGVFPFPRNIFLFPGKFRKGRYPAVGWLVTPRFKVILQKWQASAKRQLHTRPGIRWLQTYTLACLGLNEGGLVICPVLAFSSMAPFRALLHLIENDATIGPKCQVIAHAT